MAILVFFFVCASGSSKFINNGTWGHIGNAKNAEDSKFLPFLKPISGENQAAAKHINCFDENRPYYFLLFVLEK